MSLSQQVNMVNLKSEKQLWSFFPQKMTILSYLTKASKIMGSPKAKKKFLTSTCFHSPSRKNQLIDHVPGQSYSQHFTSSIQPFRRTHATDNEVYPFSNLKNQSLVHMFNMLLPVLVVYPLLFGLVWFLTGGNQKLTLSESTHYSTWLAKRVK